MPKAPILSREGFYKRLGDGTIVPLDWNLVNTTLGAMLEQRQTQPIGAPLPELIDAHDAGFTRLTEMDENKLANIFSTSGAPLPVTFFTT